MVSGVDEQLLQAAYEGNLEAVRAALQQGANVDAAGQFGDTALNQAAESGHLELVQYLVEAGAELDHKGGADKTPLMNATFAGHIEVVQFLLGRGARVNDDLLSSLQLKVNILEENAEAGFVNPQAAEGWKGFLDYMITERIKQDLPEILEALRSRASEERVDGLRGIHAAAERGVDVSAAIPHLAPLLTDLDAETRRLASTTLAIHHARNEEWAAVQALLGSADIEIQQSALLVVAPAIRAQWDVASLLPSVIALLGSGSAKVRHDAAVALGYAALNQMELSTAISQLTARLSDDDLAVRKMATWALYRIAKQERDISEARPALETLLSDEDAEQRDMARELLDLING